MGVLTEEVKSAPALILRAGRFDSRLVLNGFVLQNMDPKKQTRNQKLGMNGAESSENTFGKTINFFLSAIRRVR